MDYRINNKAGISVKFSVISKIMLVLFVSVAAVTNIQFLISEKTAYWDVVPWYVYLFIVTFSFDLVFPDKDQETELNK